MFANGQWGGPNYLWITEPMSRRVISLPALRLPVGWPVLHSPPVCPNKRSVPATVWCAINIAQFLFIMFKESLYAVGNAEAFLRSQPSEASNLEFKVG